MTTEREMLEYAAKACGMANPCYMELYQNKGINRGPTMALWNPRTDSEDCAAMCAKLDINTFWWSHTKEVECVGLLEDANHTDKHGGTDTGKEAAWRYAATMVAAKIGGMK